MRKLGLDDAFAFSEILDMMGIDESLSKIMNEAMSKDKPQEYAGQQMVMSIIKNMHKAKQPIKEWVASINDLSIEEVEALGLLELKDLIMGIFQGEDVTAFFSSLVGTEQN